MNEIVPTYRSGSTDSKKNMNEIIPTYWYDSTDMKFVLDAVIHELGGFAPGSFTVVTQTAKHISDKIWVAVTGPATIYPGDGGEQQYTPENRLDKHILGRLTEGNAYKAFLLRETLLEKTPAIQQYLETFSQLHKTYITRLAKDDKRFSNEDDWSRFCTLNYAFFTSIVDQVKLVSRADKDIYANIKKIVQYGFDAEPTDENYDDCVKAWGNDSGKFDAFIDQFSDSGYFSLLAKLSANSNKSDPFIQVKAQFAKYYRAVDVPEHIFQTITGLKLKIAKDGFILSNIFKTFVLPVMDATFIDQLKINDSECQTWGYQLLRVIAEMGATKNAFFENWQKKYVNCVEQDDMRDVMDELLPLVLAAEGNKGMLVVPLNTGGHWVRVKLHIENTEKGISLSGEYIDPFGGSGGDLESIFEVAAWRCLQVQLHLFLTKNGVSDIHAELLNFSLYQYKARDKNCTEDPGYALYKFLCDKAEGNDEAIDTEALKKSIRHYCAFAGFETNDLLVNAIFNFLQAEIQLPIRDYSYVDQSYPKLQDDSSSCGVITIQGVADDITGNNTLGNTILPSGAEELRQRHILNVLQHLCSTNEESVAKASFEHFMADRGSGVKATGFEFKYTPKPKKFNPPASSDAIKKLVSTLPATLRQSSSTLDLDSLNDKLKEDGQPLHRRTKSL